MSDKDRRQHELLDALNLTVGGDDTNPNGNGLANSSTSIASQQLDLHPTDFGDSDDVDHLSLLEGDIIGEGIPLRGHSLTRVELPSVRPNFAEREPGRRFRVVGKLGTGSYAVVYLVREEAEGESDYELGLDDMDDIPTPQQDPPREYAIKCLSKANLDEDALAAQLLEATFHQSLPIHSNIVTLHRTLHTPDYLILLLEFVPGQDLFYFLEQSRDSFSSSTNSLSDLSKTPTTPSLLSALHPAALLSHTRLRLVASMFKQMCDAVSACHARGIYHRDIKPENFIVTESTSASGDRRVVVKLTDFGLATQDEESSDMDCGSAPYMSFECRNNLAPTYAPRWADVWSLGIVLVNMLYHHNPWSDTSLQEENQCPSFELYRKSEDKALFFERRFIGMTRTVAVFLATKVFSFIEEDGKSHRCTAEEFGMWAKSLPELLGKDIHFMGGSAVSGSSSGIGIGRVGRSRRPSMRSGVSSTVSYFSINDLVSPVDPNGPPMPDPDIERDDDEGDTASRVSTGARRRKRGARNKSKNSVTPREEEFAPDVASDKLDDMAVKSQLLARELSKANSWISSTNSVDKVTQASNGQLDMPREDEGKESVKGKKSRWKGMFRMASVEGLSSAASTSTSSPPPVPSLPSTRSLYEPSHKSRSSATLSTSSAGSASAPRGETANNVSNLVFGLNPQETRSRERDRNREDKERGRKARPPQYHSSSPWSPNPRIEFVPPKERGHPNPYNISQHSRRPDQSPNWRNSMSTTVTSSTTSSANWTRYSNSSIRSVDTTATSASGGSWRSVAAASSSNALTDKPAVTSPPPSPLSPGRTPPSNIKMMNGVPWELGQLPRGCHPRPEGDIFGSPPARKSNKFTQGGPSTVKPSLQLDTINERAPSTPAPLSPLGQGGNGWRSQKDAATSTTDLGEEDESQSSPTSPSGTDRPPKVQKGQINALAKMLSVIRR